MKTLTLFRHAKSGWDSPVARDFDRPLNERGRKGAKLMGVFSKRERLTFDHVISSPAVRCLDCARLIAFIKDTLTDLPHFR